MSRRHRSAEHLRQTLLLLLSFLLAATAVSFAQTASNNRIVTVDHGAKDPAVSPDGQSIAVSILGKIFIVPRAGGEARQISSGISWDTNPAWSPDGRFLAYAHNLPGSSDLVVRNMDSGHSQVVYHAENQIQQIAFARQHGGIFFLLRRSQYDAHLWRVSIEGEGARALTETQNWHEDSFALSPDGRHAFIDSGRYGGSNLYVLDFEPFKSRRLTNTPYNQSSVQWSRDGKRLVYVESVNGQESVMMAEVEDAVASRRAAAFAAPQRIFSSPYDHKQVALDPQGGTAVLCAGRKLFHLDLGTGKVQPIAFTARFAMAPQSPADLFIIHARVVSATSSEPLEDATIEVRGGKIVAVHKGSQALPSGSVPVIDASGKTVVPGLMDNHYHFWDVFDGPRLLARGVTVIRDPGSDLADTLNYREAIGLGLVPGPHIYTTGPLIDGPGGYHPMVDVEIDDPAGVAPLVRSLKAQGVDALKVYFMLRPEVVAEVIREAHAQGLRVTGHLGVRTSWSQALDDGIDGFNHVRLWPEFLPPAEQPQGENESLDGQKYPVARMQADWSKIDPESDQAGAVIKKMVEHHVGFDPTLVVQHMTDFWRRAMGLEQFETARETFMRMSQFVGRAQKMGVMILAGTDDSNLFDELENYATAGISTPEIIKAATVNGAQWLGKQNEFGTIEPGKRADLLIVEGDPLKDIKELRKIFIVIQDGRVVFSK